jgi:hypothetical protein
VSEKEKQSAINLKRSVTIKAIVTEDFKKYLVFEAEEGIRLAERQFSQIDTSANELLNAMTDLEQRRHISSQLEIERKNFQNAVRSFEQKIQEAKALQVGTSYVQGAVEGFVSVKEGDNLYQKLGGVELIVKDGVVQKIGRIPPDIR